MDSTSGFDPDAYLASQAASVAQPQVADTSGFDPDAYLKSADQEQYGSGTEQAKAGLEGVAKGVAGPLAPYLERHALGISYKDQLGREKANPVTAGVGEAVGLAGSSLTGVGEGALLSKAGEAASGLAGLGKVSEAAGAVTEANAAYKAAIKAGDAAEMGKTGVELAKAKEAYQGLSTSSKIGTEAINQATQMALYQGGDEVSKMLLNDPDASADNAIAHIGLSAALGGVTGAALGSISPLWQATIGKRVAPVLEDMKGQAYFRLNNLDMPGGVAKELQDLHDNVGKATKMLYSSAEHDGGLRGEVLAKAMPEVSDKASAIIDGHVQQVVDKTESTLEKMSTDAYTKSKVPYLTQDLNDMMGKLTDSNASYATKYDALNDFKGRLAFHSKLGKSTLASLDDKSFAVVAHGLWGDVQKGLENPEVWGKAADIQKEVNSTIHDYLNSSDAVSKYFTVKGAGGNRVVDPVKVNTYVNQLGKPQAELKKEALKEYLGQTHNVVDTVNDIMTKHGLEPQFNHTSTAVLSNTVGDKTAGAKLVDSLIDKHIQGVLGKTAGGITGGAIGSAVGHPGLGFLLGEHALGPVFGSVIPGINKPLMENPTSVQGFKSAIDYGVAVAKGEKSLAKSVANTLKPGTMVLSASQMPNDKSREAMSKTIDHLEASPEKIPQLNNGSLNHYLPAHQQAVTTSTVRSAQYLQSLKPKPFRASPLDREIQPSNAEMTRYNRALDIAQSPAIVLQHVKDGTLQATDIQDLNTMYPGYYKSISQKLSSAIMDTHNKGEAIPYRTRMGVSLLLGQPLDSSMKPTSILAAQPKPTPPPQQQPNHPKSMNKLGKSNNNYKTASQTAESDRSNRD